MPKAVTDAIGALCGALLGAVTLFAGDAAALTFTEDFDALPLDPPGVYIAGTDEAMSIGDLSVPGTPSSSACGAFLGATGSALCGANVNGGQTIPVADPNAPRTADAEIVRFTGIDFTQGGTIDFSLGATTQLDFEVDQDFIQVTAGGVVIAFFEVFETGPGGTTKTLGTQSALLGGAAGVPRFLSEDTLVAFTVDVEDIGSTQTNGNLDFAFFSTSSAELLAIDAVSFAMATPNAPVPLPPSGFLIMGSLCALYWLSHRRRLA